jgi:transcriptional regulator of acetoin/glycerol metabolism
MRIHWRPLYIVTQNRKVIAEGLPHDAAKELKNKISLSGSSARVTLDKEANAPPPMVSFNKLQEFYRKYTILSLSEYLGISTNTIYRRLRKAGFKNNYKSYKYNKDEKCQTK